QPDGHGNRAADSSQRTDAGSRKERKTLAKGATAVKPRKLTSRIRTRRRCNDCDLQPPRISFDIFFTKINRRSQQIASKLSNALLGVARKLNMHREDEDYLNHALGFTKSTFPRRTP